MGKSLATQLSVFRVGIPGRQKAGERRAGRCDEIVLLQPFFGVAIGNLQDSTDRADSGISYQSIAYLVDQASQP
jgi:hypothetical protein